MVMRCLVCDTVYCADGGLKGGGARVVGMQYMFLFRGKCGVKAAGMGECVQTHNECV